MEIVIGSKVNSLTVKEFVKDNNGRTRLKCECDCGNTTYAYLYEFTSGHKKSCGCLKHRSNAQNLLGQRFGLLTVIKRVGTTENRKALWKCKCDCGKSTIVRTADLKSGNTKSCGCLGKRKALASILIQKSKERSSYGKH